MYAVKMRLDWSNSCKSNSSGFQCRSGRNDISNHTAQTKIGGATMEVKAMRSNLSCCSLQHLKYSSSTPWPLSLVWAWGKDYYILTNHESTFSFFPNRHGTSSWCMFALERIKAGVSETGLHRSTTPVFSRGPKKCHAMVSRAWLFPAWPKVAEPSKHWRSQGDREAFPASSRLWAWRRRLYRIPRRRRFQQGLYYPNHGQKLCLPRRVARQSLTQDRSRCGYQRAGQTLHDHSRAHHLCLRLIHLQCCGTGVDSHG